MAELNAQQIARLRPDLIVMLDGFDRETVALRKFSAAVCVAANDSSGIDGYLATLRNVVEIDAAG